MKHTKLFSFLFLLAISITLLAQPVSAGGNLATEAPTKQEIREKWQEVTASDSVFAQEPSVTAPYQAGVLTDELLESGLSYLNYVRFVANMPAVKLSDTLNEDAQHGAVVLAAIQELTHYPQQPDDMDDAFFERGAAATSSSNIFSSTCPSNLGGILQWAVSAFMDDDVGPSNLSRVGHRRWLLNPKLLYTGFGFAQAENSNCYVTTKVFDSSAAPMDYHYVAWPAAGNFPTHLLSTTVPWSVSLNPSEYLAPSRSDVQVTLTRQSDGQVWTFDSSSAQPWNGYESFMAVDTSNVGLRHTIIFHIGADNIRSYEGIFTVEISGIYTANGTPTTLSYQVDFFDVDALDAPSVSVSNVASTGKPKLSWKAVAGAKSYKVYRSADGGKSYTLLKTVTGTSLTNTRTEVGKAYSYYVVAVNANGKESAKSSTVTCVCALPRPLVKVSNVASSGKPKLTWEKVTGAKSYSVYRSADGGKTYSLLKTVTDTSLTNTGAEAGKTYYYQVSALHPSVSEANSACSAPVSRTCDLPRPLVKVSNVASSGKPKLTWEKIEGAKSYKVYRSVDGGKTYSLLKTTTGTSLTNTSTEAGKTYYYKVFALHASTGSANSAYSAPVSRTCDLPRPVAKVTLNTAGKPVITWQKVAGAVKYTLYIYDADGNLLKTSTTTGAKITHTSATAGTAYRYRVAALAAVTSANSAKSSTVSITAK